jgi:hypothetical protein
MKQFFYYSILPLTALLFGCTKDDFTWNIQKRPCVISFSSSTQDYINFISIADMSNSTLGTGPRNFFEDKSIQLKKGQEYSLSIGYENNSSALFVYAYFDWNCDGDYGDSEESFIVTNDVNSTTATLPIKVPTSAKIGETVARFVIRAEYSIDNDPCFEGGSYGEVEDYPLILQ